MSHDTKSHPWPNAQKKTLATPKLTSSPFNINVDLRKEEGGKKKKSWASVSFPQLAEQNFDLKFVSHHFCTHNNAKSTNWNAGREK
jgi:hypothetical protein